MTRREEFEKAIRALRKIQNGQLIDLEDWTIYDIIQFLERAKPKPYESRAKAKCICGNSGRSLTVCYGLNKYAGLCRIECDKCSRTTAWCKTEKEAIKAWNNFAYQTHD